EAAGDPARNRPRRDRERLADRVVALVACEEAIENLATALGQRVQRIVHGERVIEAQERLVDPRRLELVAARLLAPARPEAVDAAATRELGEPRPDRLVVAEAGEVFVHLGEHVLEDVLGVVVGQPERLGRDRVDVTGEPLDELVPRGVVAGSTACDELAVGERAHPTIVGKTRREGALPSLRSPSGAAVDYADFTSDVG